MIFYRIIIPALLSCIQLVSYGQFSYYEKQPALLGVHFTLQDFLSGKWGKNFSSMAPGVSVSYLKGINRRMDIGFSAGVSFPDSIKGTVQKNKRPAIVQAGLSGRIRAFPYPRTLQPFLLASVDAAVYKNHFSTYLSPGAGLQLSYRQVSLIIQTGYGWELNGSMGNKFFYSIGLAGLIKPGKGKRKKIISLAKVQEMPAPLVSDRDQDGIPDSLDHCPEQAGDQRFSGCPDSDGDGIRDGEDQCPAQAGPVSLNGCPVVDRDKDGVPDETDKCPDEMGFTQHNGCPLEGQKPQAILSKAAEEIYFETARYSLLPASYPALNRVDSLLKALPLLQLVIEGHTDNQGSERSNLMLSKNRATAVKNYLTGKGHDPNRFSVAGYGASQPVDSNENAEGRQRNRRVIIRIKE